MKRVTPTDASFEKIVQTYLEKRPDRVDPHNVGSASELEIRFQGPQKISRTDYDNTVKQLFASGFKPLQGDMKGQQMMRMYGDKAIMGDTRVELAGTDLIQEYCYNNSLDALLAKHGTDPVNKIKLTQKVAPQDDAGNPIPYVDVKDFGFRVSFKMEKDTPLLSTESERKLLGGWKDMKKTFRYMNRVRFAHPDLPVFADLSIIKMSKQPEYSIQDSNVLHLMPTYEIELEIDNAKCGPGTNVNVLLTQIRKAIRVIMQALQQSSYPISLSERARVLQEYLVMVHNGTKTWDEIETEATRRQSNGSSIDWSRYFVGPASKTLQWENMRALSEESGDANRVNILRNYTVTDKADGDRKMLFVASTGRIYFLDINMNVSYTGSRAEDKELHRTLLDGEHIGADLFAAFDVYYIRGINCRALPFVKIAGQEDVSDDRFRLYNLETVCNRLVITDPVYRVENMQCYLKIRCKTFYSELGWNNAEIGLVALQHVDTLLDGCATLLQGRLQFGYETDGLIFTPCSKGVQGCTDIKEVMFKKTWAESFKWKPTEFNTIDFMVRHAGANKVFHDAVTGASYKRISLWCGFNPARDLKHVYCDYALNDKLPEKGGESYKMKPVRFIPSVEPYDVDAYLCHIPVIMRSANNYVMQIEGSQETFDENTIVEFRYDLSEPNAVNRWKPIRVRHDKTEQLRQYHNNFGNAYEVANNNWYSIHHPISKDMLCGLEPVPVDSDADDDMYYNRPVDDRAWQKTRSLRDFHNKYVKSSLIQAAVQMLPASTKKTFVDLAVGKAGDLYKWTEAGIQFVLGIDISRDNLSNSMDGACKRYIEWREKNRYKPFRALFLQGDCGKHIGSGAAFTGDKKVMQTLLGKTKDTEYKLVKDNFAIAQKGFPICSCQFAIHYFFKDRLSLNEFLRNVNELTAEGGYFIGTCYDGRTVFDLLKGASLPIMATYKNADTGEPIEMFKIERKYTQDVFENDATSLGYRIDVYQETINKVFAEYLVCFEYLKRLFAEYGFDLADDAKAKECGLPGSSGMFESMFESMVDSNQSYGFAASLSDGEKKVSFLNRYFVFKKVRMANADVVFQKQMAMDRASVESVESVQSKQSSNPVIRTDDSYEVASSDSDSDSDSDSESDEEKEKE